MTRLLRLLGAVFILLAGCGGDRTAEPWLGAPRPIPSPAGVGARFPNLAVAGKDVAVMSWLEPATDGAFRLRHASFAGNGSWTVPTTVAEGKDWFVNWADFPSVVPVDETNWAAHWLQQKPGSVYSYDVRVSLSGDGGRTWSTPFSPHDDGTPTEHGFVSIASVEGRPYAVWLDGRNTTGEGHGHDTGHGSGGAMTLRGAILGKTGAEAGTELDGRVCDCCQTDAAPTTDGLFVVYRDRGNDETRDIHATRLTRAGWSKPVAVHADGWRIDACPVNGPAAAARGEHVAVAWFTAADQPRVRLAWSRDGGRTFAAPIEVAAGRVLGRVDVVLLEDDRAVVSWLAETPAGAVIRAQPFTRAGAAGPAIDVATADVARSSGFPQMASTNGGLLFAWTGNGATPTVRTVFAPLR